MKRHSSQHILGLAQGRWIEILVAAGIPAERLDGRGHPCPRCGGRDRFNAFPGVQQCGAVHCRRCFTRGTEPRPGNGLSTLMWIQGVRFPEAIQWLANYLGVDGQESHSSGTFVSAGSFSTSHKTPQSTAAEIRRMTQLTIDSMRRITSNQLSDLSKRLHVSETSLRSLCVGYSTDHDATTWPMRNANGEIIGIRLRASDGDKKWSYRGSRSGLFLLKSQRPTGKQVFIVEGASDLAAASDLSLPCIGRPCCSGGTDQVSDYLGRVGYRSVTLIADHDEAGIQGATRLAKSLSIRGFETQVVAVDQQANDLREMLRRGATTASVLSLPVIEQFAARPVREQLTFDFAA
ncbi:MAG: toprim domain-containing protein [Pirellulaceae bacterium]